MNVYDMREKCKVPPFCYNEVPTTTFFDRPDIQRQLGVEKPIDWQACSMSVNALFRNDFMRSYQQSISPLLEAGISAVVYAGDCDYICNWLGNKAWTLILPWSGQQSFLAAEDRAFFVPVNETGGAAASSTRHGGNVRSHGPFRCYG